MRLTQASILILELKLQEITRGHPTISQTRKCTLTLRDGRSLLLHRGSLTKPGLQRALRTVLAPYFAASHLWC